MKTFRYVFFILIYGLFPADAGLLINEVVTATRGDWVELVLRPGDCESMDISRFYVTMYYGTNEPLASEPVTLRTLDNPLTPWDDRYAVVHLTSPGIPDETDITGDTNHDGIRDLYCANYINSLWNSDCIVAVDSDDDPSNGGITDCLIYSSHDGDLPASLLPFMENAVKYGAWNCTAGDIQGSALDIGRGGLASYMSIIRIGETDSNTAPDFALTRLPTPGRENMLLAGRSGREMISLAKRTVVCSFGNAGNCNVEFDVHVQSPCDIDYRIYSSNGREIYASQVARGIVPGTSRFSWRPVHGGRLLPTGLYFCRMRVRNGGTGRQEEHLLKLVIHNRRG